MTSRPFFRGRLVLLPTHVVLACFFLPGCLAQVYYPTREVRVSDLPQLTAKSKRASDVLSTSVEIIVNDKKICCGKDSALEDSVQSADPKSLKDVASKLQGRHLLGEGRPIMVTAEYMPAATINASDLIGRITQNHALLMQWNSHLYVVYGVIYQQTVDQDGSVLNAIHKLLLLDPRFSDARREVSFDRSTDDWGKVESLLALNAALP